MATISIPQNVLNQINKKNKDVVVYEPEPSKQEKITTIYKQLILKNYTHPVKILAKQTEKMLEIQQMLEDRLRESVDEGMLDVQVSEAYRRYAHEIKEYVQELAKEWDVVIDASIDTETLEAVMDLDTFFKFLADKDENMVEEYIEFRLNALKPKNIDDSATT